MKKVIIFAILSFIFTTGFGQRYLLYDNVENEWAKRNTNYGPNKKHYFYPYLKAGQTIGASADSLPAKYWGSGSFGIGIRYKNKLTSWWSHGLDLSYNYQTYSIAQNNEKMLIDNIQYEKEKLNLHQIFGNYYWRFRMGRAGNYLGKFFDVGGYGAWNIGKNHVIKADEGIVNAKKQKTKFKNVDYLEDIEYGIIARIGFPRVAFYGQYRLSTLLKDMPDNSDKLPNIVVGIELSLNR
ncbi:MAG: hypothetical protein C0599_11270 [Salinivirgaceae bacterium]|nr:MAG: hypothetical protein C0599_11270 [Salinivirgaceae bacterium]